RRGRADEAAEGVSPMAGAAGNGVPAAGRDDRFGKAARAGGDRQVDEKAQGRWACGGRRAGTARQRVSQCAPKRRFWRFMALGEWAADGGNVGSSGDGPGEVIGPDLRRSRAKCVL